MNPRILEWFGFERTVLGSASLGLIFRKIQDWTQREWLTQTSK